MSEEKKYTLPLSKKLRDRLDRLKKEEKGSDERNTTLNELRQILKKQKNRQKKPKPADLIIYKRGIPRQMLNRYTPSPVPEFSDRLIYLDDAVKGSSQTHRKYGNSFLVSTRISEYVEDGIMTGAITGAFKSQLTSRESNLYQKIAGSCGIVNPVPDNFIFMDIETTGLGTSPLFLIGAMIWDRDDFEVRQYFARDYSEEASVISFFLDLCAEKRILVTFNGKSFDLPYIRTRAIANGIPYLIDPLHYDLLHESRRIWRGILPNCKLQTIETYVCGRPRYGDIPGAMIPDAYHNYVRTQDAREMAEVLKHNFLDLVTMADIMTRFPDR